MIQGLDFFSGLAERLASRLGLGVDPSESGDGRTGRMLATGSASSFVQIVGLATSFVVTPLLVRHLGAVQYGIYATIVSTVGWLALAHIGLGPSVLNELSTERSLKSSQRGAVTVSSATAVQVLIAGFLLVSIALSAPLLPWPELFNAPSALSTVVTAATLIMLIGFVLQLPLSLGRTVFEAHQRGYVAQGWQVATHLGRLVAVVVAVAVGGSLALVVLALILPGLLAQVGQYVHAFRFSYSKLRPRRALVSWAEGRALLGVAADFFTLTIASLVITSTDNLVIAHVINPGAVTPYAVTAQLTQLPTVFMLLALQAAWPAYREAATTDVAWLRRTHQRMRRFCVGLPILAGIVLMLVGRRFIELWAGHEAVPSFGLLVVLATIALIQGVLLPRERILIALGATRLNAVLGVANAVINLPVSIVLARVYGVVGVAMGTAIGYTAVGWVVVVVSRRRMSTL
jgi:O-antigen/teichoic acid export membrane protein